MVLELLVNPRKITGKPWEMFLIGFVYSAIAVLLSFWIFRDYVSIVMITLTTIAAVPFVHAVIRREERKEVEIKEEHKLLKEHGKAISMFLWLFLGFVASFCILYIFLSSGMIEKVFGAQMQTIVAVRSTPTGNYIADFSALSTIFFNNLKILFFCIAFSFFYGAGAIFILTWNASVMATAVGSFIRANLLHTSGVMGYLQITSLGLLQYMLHGIPEIAAYFVGGLASGIISFAIVRHDFRGGNFKHILRDALDLILVALFILFVAALIEVFITPIVV